MSAREASVKAYDHCTVVDKKKGRVRCNYCGKLVTGSSRLRCHLGGVRGDVTPCEEVPEAVKELMRNDLREKKKGCLIKEVGELEHPTLPLKRNLCREMNTTDHGNTLATESRTTKHVKLEPVSVGSGTDSVSFPKRKMDFQAAVGGNDDSSIRQAKKCIGRFFYEAGVEFTAAIVPSFQRMINSILGYGKFDDIFPNCRELKGWILQNELKETQQYVQHIKESWGKRGCSILLDGWTDLKGRQLVNIIVDCPQGAVYLHSFDISAFLRDIREMSSFLDKVLKEVGVKNVVQIVSYSTSGFMQSLGKQVMDKYRSVFWTISASHCIEMMLKEMGMMNLIKDTVGKAKTMTRFIYNRAFVLKLLKNFTNGRELVRSYNIRYAAPFVTLENIMLEMGNLRRMFASSAWITSSWASTKEGKRVSNLVTDPTFWNAVRKVLGATIPLVRVLDLINEGDNEQLGHIYETMDQAKETIKDELRNNTSHYMPFWKVIDYFWDNYLHSPLHAAGYFLNPSLFYSEDFFPDPEVVNGLLCCIVRMAEGREYQDLLTFQLDKYREAREGFQEGSGMSNSSTVSPVSWWSTYGTDCPDLQKFAIRILGQTCNGASRYSLDRSMAEKLLTEGMNHLEQQRLCDMTFLHYNMQLKNFKPGVSKKILVDDINPMDDWIVNIAKEVVFPEGDLTWIDTDGGDTTTRGIDNHEEGPSSLCPEEDPKE